MKDDLTPAIVGKAIEGDDELQLEARALAKTAIRLASKYLTTGSPQMQLSIIRSLMPAVARAIADAGEGEELADMRRELQELNQKLLSA